MTDIAGVIAWKEINIAETLAHLSESLRKRTQNPCRRLCHENVVMVNVKPDYTSDDEYDRQPLQYNGWIINGSIRLYNRPQLAEKLALPATSITTLSDSDLFKYALEKWEDQVVHHLHGDFTFTAWHLAKKKLLIATDHVANIPVFYAQTPHFFAFSTSMATLVTMPGVPTEISEPVFADFIVCLPAHGKDTIYRHIKRVPAASILTVSEQQVYERQYWHLSDSPKISYTRTDEYFEHFRELYQRAVNSRLRSAGKVGAFLSGGLDSSTNSAIAAEVLASRNETLNTYTALNPTGLDIPVSRNFDLDELLYVKALKERYQNLNCHFFESWDGDFVTDVDAFFDAYGMPFRNVWARPWITTIMRAARRDNVKVMLTGDRGNYSLSWHGNGALLDMFRALRLRAMFRLIKCKAVYEECSIARIIKREVIKPLLPDAILQWRSRKTYYYGQQPWHASSAISKNFSQQINIKQRIQDAGYDQFDLDSSTGSRQLLRMSLDYSTKTDATAILSCLNAQCGLEVRDPGTDKDVIEFCLGIPSEIYQHQGKDRALVRCAFSDMLPRTIRDRRTIGYQGQNWPYQLTATKPLLKQQLALLRQSQNASDFLDIERLETLLHRWPVTRPYETRNVLEYRNVLGRGVIIGLFMQWLEASRA